MHTRRAIVAFALFASLPAFAAEPARAVKTERASVRHEADRVAPEKLDTEELEALAVEANRGIESKMAKVAEAKKEAADEERARALSDKENTAFDPRARYEELASIEHSPEAKGLMTFLKGLEKSQGRSWIVPLAKVNRQSLVLTTRGMRVYQTWPHYHEQDTLEGPVRLKTPILGRVNPSVLNFDVARVRRALAIGVERMATSLETQEPPREFDADEVLRLGWSDANGAEAP